MLIRAFIQAVFIFTIGGIFFVVSQTAASGFAIAITAHHGSVVNKDSSDRTGIEQHRVQPGHPVINPQSGTQHPQRLKPNPSTKNEIIERRSEQIKRQDFCRNLERRRQQLRQERQGMRGRGFH